MGRRTLVGFLAVLAVGLWAAVAGAQGAADEAASYGWLSILPPLFAIVLAVVWRQVILALTAGVWLGALFINDFQPLTAAMRVVDRYVAGAIADPGHVEILIFSMLLGGMIGVITRSGGGVGLAALVTGRAGTARRGLLSTWVLGLLIFFDDYANSLLVGTTMRPITDKLRVSREKLAFVVDATAAPVSSLALISSWIGVEVGYIKDQLEAVGDHHDAYMTFLESVPYRFYPILMLVFVFFIVFFGRDFGPMARAEARARTLGQVLRPGAKVAAQIEGELPEAKRWGWLLAAAPIVAVVGVALGGMAMTGMAATGTEEWIAAHPGVVPGLRDFFGEASSGKALMWGSLSGCVVAIALSASMGALKLADSLEAWLEGMRSMVVAMTILVLAWSLNSICDDLGTAQWLIGGIGGWIAPGLLGGLVFVIAAAVSFATGTSWGTMSILFPLVVPLAHAAAPGEWHVMLGAISSILAGSVWGDHCSPISDTTILSSMASSCDHVDHVRTQLPYALAVGLVSLVLGDLAVGLGLYPAWLGLLLGAGALFLVVRYVGRPAPALS